GDIPTDTQDIFLLNHHPLNPRGSTNQKGNRGKKMRVLSLEQTKINQVAKIKKLKKIIKKIEGKKKRTHSLNRECRGKPKENSRRKIVLEDDDDDVAIKATPLSSKSPTIVDYKIYREGKKSYFKIIRADGNSQNYLTFGTMFKNFNREDLEVLRSIIKERFKKKNPVDDMDNMLFQTLKTIFEHHVEDIIWKYQQGAVKVHY
nr:hypothetical protein [Tanacetum cinerariifolium]